MAGVFELSAKLQKKKNNDNNDYHLLNYNHQGFP